MAFGYSPSRRGRGSALDSPFSGGPTGSPVMPLHAERSCSVALADGEAAMLSGPFRPSVACRFHSVVLGQATGCMSGRTDYASRGRLCGTQFGTHAGCLARAEPTPSSLRLSLRLCPSAPLRSFPRSDSRLTPRSSPVALRPSLPPSSIPHSAIRNPQSGLRVFRGCLPPAPLRVLRALRGVKSPSPSRAPTSEP